MFKIFFNSLSGCGILEAKEGQRCRQNSSCRQERLSGKTMEEGEEMVCVNILSRTYNPSNDKFCYFKDAKNQIHINPDTTE